MGRVRKRKHSIHRAMGAVRFGGDLARESLFLLRANSTPPELFERFPKVVTSPDLVRVIHGDPFPSNYDQMFRTPAVGRALSTVSEAVWAICRCCMHGSELKLYLENREKFESCMLQGAFDEAATLLASHQERLGVSLWLAQAWMTLGDSTPAGLKQRIQEGFETAAPNPVTSFMLHYLGRRAESRGPKKFLKDELIAKLDDASEDFRAYASSRVHDVHAASPSELSAILFFEAQGSLIDHYEALIATLQDMASAEHLPNKITAALAKPVALLRKRVGDRRLRPFALCFVGTLETDIYAENLERAGSFEAYFQGHYSEAVTLAARHLVNSDPTDAATLTLLARAVVRCDCSIPALPSGLEAICKSLIDVLRLGESAYGEATSIFSTVDRHYGHSWAIYLRAVVMLCLQQESTTPMVSQMRELATLDPYVSPISLACTRPTSIAAVRQQLHASQAYRHTTTAIEALYYGDKSAIGSTGITDRRRLSFLGRYHLGCGQHGIALVMLEELLAKVSPGGRYRTLAALAMTMAESNNTEAALALLTEAYLDNPEAPTSLPLNVVMAGLTDADKWPETIDVPIGLELYNAFSSDDRLAELRFAFERYQELHGIKNPADLSEKLGKGGKAKATLYLDRVWTPEVMRQTLLYNGSQEIDEARIEVCRQLAFIDPDNATRYFDEIRDRVKWQEIAKGTSLIEQSKVYVDIAAIKRSLKAKIGGQYSRYKANSGVRNEASHAVVEQIADALLDLTKTENVSISKVLSNLHLVADVETETDSQFDPIFTEVTHEFLRGDHGLNAYLSTRVRHGVLANTLRKPLADERLITTKDDTGQSYRRNLYWDERLEGHDLSIRELVAESLERFAASFDIIVKELRDEYLQIAISHNVKDVRQDAKAAFVYRSSNLERRFMQRYAVRARTIEEFIDVCIDNLWEKTDENLLSVRKLLDEAIRPRFMTLFDQLTDDIHGLAYSTPIGDLRNGIGRAKTQLRLRLDEISSWFKRSQVYDRQDYQAGLPVDIALNMITKTSSEASVVPKVVVAPYDRGLLMPGRTLDGMVDAFYVILSNAIEHSGLNGADLEICISFTLSQNHYAVKVESALGDQVPSDAQRVKVEDIRDGLNRSDSRRLAQIEGGSGLRKLWRSINSPFYESPSLDFGFSRDRTFYVEISYNIEVFDENLDR